MSTLINPEVLLALISLLMLIGGGFLWIIKWILRRFHDSENAVAKLLQANAEQCRHDFHGLIVRVQAQEDARNAEDKDASRMKLLIIEANTKTMASSAEALQGIARVLERISDRLDRTHDR